MKKIDIKKVSANQSGDYFQVYFDNDEETYHEDNIYFLIQWGSEFENEENEPYYIECNDQSYIGHFKGRKATLGQNYFHLQVMNEKELKEIEITFPDQDSEEYQEAERILKIIIPNIKIEK